MEEKFQVIKGAESFFLKGNEVGILISHGFNGTPQSVREVGEKLGGYGYSVLTPRLKGHGTHFYDLENCTGEDWFESLEKGYHQLQEQCTDIFVLGQSMGGTLALMLARKYPEISGLILINTALSLPAYEYLRGKTTPRFIDESRPDIRARGVHEIVYHKVPIKAIHQLQKIMERASSILSDIECPVLCMNSLVDHVVPPENADLIIRNVRSKIKEKSLLKHSYHVATLDNDKGQIVKDCHRFIQQQIRRETEGMSPDSEKIFL